MKTAGDYVVGTARFAGLMGSYVVIEAGVLVVGSIFPKQIARLEARVHPPIPENEPATDAGVDVQGTTREAADQPDGLPTAETSQNFGIEPPTPWRGRITGAEDAAVETSEIVQHQ